MCRTTGTVLVVRHIGTFYLSKIISPYVSYPPVGKPPADDGNFFAHRDKRFEKNEGEKRGEERKGEREKRGGREEKKSICIKQTTITAMMMAKVASIEQTLWCWCFCCIAAQFIVHAAWVLYL
jgi:hypothetical protein